LEQERLRLFRRGLAKEDIMLTMIGSSCPDIRSAREERRIKKVVAARSSE
jgi:hypothetical protein